MYPDTTDDYIDFGLFLEAPSVLTKEEYFGKVMFHSEAAQSIQSSEFEPRISYEINKDGTISFNFGDLLSNIPVFERLKWKLLQRNKNNSRRPPNQREIQITVL